MNIRHNLNIVGEHFFDNSGLEFVVIRESGRSERGDMLYIIASVPMISNTLNQDM